MGCVVPKVVASLPSALHPAQLRPYPAGLMETYEGDLSGLSFRTPYEPMSCGHLLQPPPSAAVGVLMLSNSLSNCSGSSVRKERSFWQERVVGIACLFRGSKGSFRRQTTRTPLVDDGEDQNSHPRHQFEPTVDHQSLWTEMQNICCYRLQRTLKMMSSLG